MPSEAGGCSLRMLICLLFENRHTVDEREFKGLNRVGVWGISVFFSPEENSQSREVLSLCGAQEEFRQSDMTVELLLVLINTMLTECCVN